VNVIDEVSDQRCPGFVEFKLNGETHKLDAIKEGEGLFFVFRDGAAGDTTFKAARFLDIQKQPTANETFMESLASLPGVVLTLPNSFGSFLARNFWPRKAATCLVPASTFRTLPRESPSRKTYPKRRS
jgi:hypothetical protein